MPDDVDDLEDLDIEDLSPVVLAESDEEALPELTLDEPSGALAMPALEDDVEVADASPSLAGEDPPVIPEPEARTGGTDDRIQQLIDEGQEAFEAGEFQAAIDVWSRIFLIDIDNEEASARIESARGQKAELERQAEEVFHEGLGHLEQQDLDAARTAFERVLEVQPTHSVAREYLDQLDAGEVPVARATTDHERPSESLSADEDLEEEGGSPSLEAAVQRDRVVVVKGTDRRLLMLGGLVLVFLLAGVGFLAIKWTDLFPNADEELEGARQAPSVVERAVRLYEKGSTEAAMKILESVPTLNPAYDRSQALLAQWRALSESAATEPVDTGPSEDDLRRHAALISEARAAMAGSENILGRRLLARAAKIAPLEDADQKLDLQALRTLAPLKGDLELYGMGEWERLLPGLWRQYDEQPTPDLRLLIVESYYNLALRALRRGDATDSLVKLQEAAKLDPSDVQIERMLRFSESYENRPQDLLYRIFVKYLPSRP